MIILYKIRTKGGEKQYRTILLSDILL